MFLAYFFKSYQRKTFGGSARPLIKEGLEITNGTYKVSIKFEQNINQEFFKVEYQIKLSKYFGNSAKERVVV